jgi:hypothetical protein
MSVVNMEKTRKVAFMVPFWYRDQHTTRRLGASAHREYHTWLPATAEMGQCARQVVMAGVKRRQMQWFGF